MEDAGNRAPENGPPVTDADRPLCDLPKDGLDKDGCVPADLLHKLDLSKCRLEKNTCFSLEEPAKPAKPRKAAKALEAVPQPKESVVEEVKQEVPVEAPILLASNDAPHAAEATSASPTVESVGVDQAIGQMKSLIPAGQDASPALMVGGAAVLAVVGAAIKLGPGFIKAAQAAKMKKLEIEEKKAEQGEENHAKCSAERAMLEVKLSEQANQISALSSKLSEVEKKVSAKAESGSIDLGDFDPEEMQERLEAIEKALKKATAPAKKPQGKKK